jgi:transposase
MRPDRSPQPGQQATTAPRSRLRDGKTQWTKIHRQWIARQRLDDDLAHAALAQMLIHLDGLDRQLDALDRDLEQIARSERWAPTVQTLTGFKGIATRTALGLISEIGDFARFSHPRELSSWLGIVPSEYSSGQQRHRGHITTTGNRHARRLLIEAAWSYRHPPRLRDRGPQRDQRAWQAEIRLHRRYKHLTSQGKRPTIATVAAARELTGFLWAATTNQPILQEAVA